MTNELGNILDVEPLDGETLPTVNPSKHLPSNVASAMDDVEYARANIRDLIENGAHAVDELMEIARQSQHPRTYEVLAKLIQTMSDTNRQLIDTHEVTREQDQAASTTNNNVYVGSTADLLKLMKQTQDD